MGILDSVRGKLSKYKSDERRKTVQKEREFMFKYGVKSNADDSELAHQAKLLTAKQRMQASEKKKLSYEESKMAFEDKQKAFKKKKFEKSFLGRVVKGVSGSSSNKKYGGVEFGFKQSNMGLRMPSMSINGGGSGVPSLAEQFGGFSEFKTKRRKQKSKKRLKY